MFSGEPITQNEFVNSCHEFTPSDTGEYKPDTTLSRSPVFNPQDLLGHSFLMDKQADGQRPRGTLVQLLEDHESSIEENTTRIKFRVSKNNNQHKEIIMYNKVLEYITKD
jgi:hypothetical protein